jgi:hypothetical protein
MTHPASKSAATQVPRKSGGPVCEFCGEPAKVVYSDQRSGALRYFCAKDWNFPLGESDGVFREIHVIAQPLQVKDGKLAVIPWKADWTASTAQVEQRNERERAKLAGWRTVMFDWSIGTDVDRESLRIAAERGWVELQDLYRANTVIKGEMFWQIRNEARYLRSAMTHVCIDKGAAKRRQLELTPDPLTFCTGTARVWKRACGRVFADTTHASGGGRTYWLSWCPDHQANQIAATRR